jgi:hypothetical protein
MCRTLVKTDINSLLPKLDNNTDLVIGDVTETIEPWMKDNCSSDSPIGFIAFDLDMYYGTKAAMKVLKGESDWYLPKFWCYLDDIRTTSMCSKNGELLAVSEFNLENKMRSIEVYPFLETERLFKNAGWIHQMRHVNILDHPSQLKQS